MKFKVGDKVKRIGQDHHKAEGPRLGKVYTVSATSQKGAFIGLSECPAARAAPYYSTAFELVASAQQTPARYKYNVGDMVQWRGKGAHREVIAANERTFLVKECAYYGQHSTTWEIVGVEMKQAEEGVSCETPDDACKRLCPSIMNGHYHGCPFLRTDGPYSSSGKRSG